MSYNFCHVYWLRNTLYIRLARVFKKSRIQNPFHLLSQKLITHFTLYFLLLLVLFYYCASYSIIIYCKFPLQAAHHGTNMLRGKMRCAHTTNHPTLAPSTQRTNQDCPTESCSYNVTICIGIKWFKNLQITLTLKIYFIRIYRITSSKCNKLMYNPKCYINVKLFIINHTFHTRAGALLYLNAWLRVLTSSAYRTLYLQTLVSMPITLWAHFSCRLLHKWHQNKETGHSMNLSFLQGKASEQ